MGIADAGNFKSKQAAKESGLFLKSGRFYIAGAPELHSLQFFLWVTTS